MTAVTGQALDALSAADQRLLAICDLAPAKSSPDRTGAPPARIAGLRYLEAALRSLSHAIGGADGAPSPDAVTGFDLQKLALSAALADWSRFKSVDLPRLNSALRSAGSSAIGR